MENMIKPILVLGLLGGLFGVLLSLASKVFAVKVDPKITQVLDALPGANCGACGFPGCEGLATAIAKGEAAVNSCPIGGQPTADVIASIMGADAGEMVKEVAVVKCKGTSENAKDKYEYDGIEDCRIQTFLADGCKACSYGCVGCGTCVNVCMFDAIHIVDGVAVVDREKCTACNKCVEICPKHLIELVPYSNKFIVTCNSNDKGKDVRANCSVGCIGCQICVKNCPREAIDFDNFLAKIDPDKCINCSICAQKCPTGAIINLRDELKKDKEAVKKQQAEKAEIKAEVKKEEAEPKPGENVEVK